MSALCAAGAPEGLLLGLAFLLAVVLLPGQALAQAPEPHQFIQEYNGPATCEACHGNVTDQVIHSVHYSWEGKMDHYSPVSGSIARINWLAYSTRSWIFLAAVAAATWAAACCPSRPTR